VAFIIDIIVAILDRPAKYRRPVPPTTAPRRPPRPAQAIRLLRPQAPHHLRLRPARLWRRQVPQPCKPRRRLQHRPPRSVPTWSTRQPDESQGQDSNNSALEHGLFIPQGGRAALIASPGLRPLAVSMRPPPATRESLETLENHRPIINDCARIEAGSSTLRGGPAT
jgi:hypothetical protein